MNNEIRNPRLADLEKKIKIKKEELLGVLNKWSYLHNIVRPQLLFVYESMFGDLEFEIEKKARLAAELERRQKALSGIRDTERQSSFGASVESRDYSDSVNYIPSGARNTDVDDAEFNIEEFPLEPEFASVDRNSKETVTLYRSIVKKLHPDVVGDSETFRLYWDSVQFAYRTGNKRHLELFRKVLCEDGRTDIDADEREKESALRGELYALESGINRENQRIRTLSGQEPFVFESYFNDITWIQRRKRRLREKIFQIERRIHFHERMIKSLSDSRSASERRIREFGSQRTARA